MRVEDISNPTPQADELHVKMTSSRINPVDMDLMKGMPFLKYKKPQIGGVDGAGTVVAVGQDVRNFKVGDKVFFYRKFSDIGTWASEISVKAADCAKVPDHISPQEAGSIALPLLTAYDSLMQLDAKRGEKILIHGAGGGVGFQAVQVAKQMGLYVIGTASQNDAPLLQKAGLDRLIDYKTQRFEEVLAAGEVDYVFDLLGDDTLLKSIQLQPRKIVSVRYIDPSQMYKAGVNMPGILRWIMRLTMRKFDQAAKKNKVQIIGQVTGANGALLQKAIDFIQQNFVSRTYPTRTLADITANGLGKNDVGRVIVF